MSFRKNKKSATRIAMIGQKHVPSREGGVEIVVWELARRLRDRGYSVECYNRSGYHLHAKDYEKIKGLPGHYYSGIRILTIPTFRSSKLNAIVYSTLATIRALFGRYDVIHYHAEGPCLMLWLPKLFGIPVVATIHGLDWQRAKWGKFASRMLKAGERTAAKHADALIVLSRNMQEYFLSEYGRKTIFIPNGIDKGYHLEPEIITKQYGLKGDDYILSLSRIVPEKGIHYLIEAFRQIPTDKKLVIAGMSGNAQEYMDEITRMAAEDPRIILTGFVHDELLEELQSNPYLFVLPSDVEGMSIGLLEAMSYGTCCLVSDIKENIEVVEDKAVSFRQGSVEDLKQKLQYLLEHPEVAHAYRDASTAFILNKYSWEKMTDETEKIYASVCGEGNR